MNRYFEGISVKADDPVSGRSGLDINIDDNALGRFLKKMHRFQIQRPIYPVKTECLRMSSVKKSGGRTTLPALSMNACRV